MKALKRLLLSELSYRNQSEKQLLVGMPKIADAASCLHLKKLIQTHHQEAQDHIEKIDKVFKLFDEVTREKKCAATVGMISEIEQKAVDFKGSPALDAALVCMAQKIKHFQIASYGCLHEWALLLANHDAAGLLDEILAENKNANRALIKMASFRCNKEALEEYHPDDSYCDRYGHELIKPEG